LEKPLDAVYRSPALKRFVTARFPVEQFRDNLETLLKG
jgi:hypothetical protein